MTAPKPTIEVDGRTYQYDYDHDIYYRTYNQTPETPRQRWTKVAVGLVVLALIMLFAHLFLHR